MEDIHTDPCDNLIDPEFERGYGMASEEKQEIIDALKAKADKNVILINSLEEQVALLQDTIIKMNGYTVYRRDQINPLKF
tara:strand:+ start:2022 stop:2261 length:240 start_codon:yes stop_codon:yes gene_type:complete